MTTALRYRYMLPKVSKKARFLYQCNCLSHLLACSTTTKLNIKSEESQTRSDSRSGTCEQAEVVHGNDELIAVVLKKMTEQSYCEQKSVYTCHRLPLQRYEWDLPWGCSESINDNWRLAEQYKASKYKQGRDTKSSGQNKNHDVEYRSLPILSLLLDNVEFKSLIKPYRYSDDDIFVESKGFNDKIFDSVDYNHIYVPVKFETEMCELSSYLETKENLKNGIDYDSTKFRDQASVMFSFNDSQNLKSNVVYRYSSNSSHLKESSGSKNSSPNQDQLNVVKDNFLYQIPRFLSDRHDYRIYAPEIIFENNYFGENQVFKGLSAYVWQLNKAKIIIHLKYAQAGMTIVSAHTHTEDGSVRIQWRIHGLPQIEAFKIWKFMPWLYKKTIKQESVWIDGYSVLHVNKDGFVYKHRIDKVILDEDTIDENINKTGLAAKIAILIGLIPRPSISDFQSLLAKKLTQQIPPHIWQ